MKIFVAKNDEELGICLRMLYPEKREVVVIPVLNERKKMEFHIKADDMDDATFNRSVLCISKSWSLSNGLAFAPMIF